MNAKKQNPSKSRQQEAPSHDWLAPISADAACGADLEYDPEYVVLSARTVQQPDAQYGNFVGSPEPVAWGDIDRDCRRLMLRSKDIRLAVLFTRARTRLAGSAGFMEGMSLLASWLDTYPDAIHPQLAVDADRDAALEIRANALQALTDTDGLLSDLREIPLVKSTATRLQVRDVERAFARPRAADALSHDSVSQQLDDLRAQTPAVLSGFDRALASLEAIEGWCKQHLDSFAPDLSALSRLLRLLARPAESAAVPNEVLEHAVVEDAGVTDAHASCDDTIVEHIAVASEIPEPDQFTRSTRVASDDRQAALQRIREARHWFETHEPSSPIPLLLKRAEQFVGKRYAEIVRAVPLELLAQWDAEI
ncbi:type VI secretion system protein TssA [Paraburkholderia sp. BCC1885]|uniref:type VI secretion system protein TssA n=1 Tax=Paraburkholderia sp. BCC1885 TaxID=2562669 RepID=UPI0011836A64|nr:type VI secretion system protein TssA [Paraburkholderia sp. BCC1885]